MVQSKNLIILILENVSPDTKDSNIWASKLEKEIAKNYKGINYKNRLRLLLPKLKHYSNILSLITPEKLAIIPIAHIDAFIAYSQPIYYS